MAVRLTSIALLIFLSLVIIVNFIEGIYAITVIHIIGIVFPITLIVICVFHFLKFGLEYEYEDIEKSRNPKLILILNILLIIVIVVGTLFVVLFLVIRVTGADVTKTSFPTGCIKTTNCFRLTNNASTNVNANGTSLFTVNTTNQDLINNINSFFPGSKVLTATGNFIQRVTYTAFFAFPDDNYFQIHCNSDHSISLFIQMESRLGTSDFGVNRQRAITLLAYLKGFKPVNTHPNCTSISYDDFDFDFFL